ncbi:Uma2 family endonuclease [Romeria aff. gracilis LEGE 07310]|uniref:Uma2 family endonuclease n=1 Tax=Vasconcelosia minhoensis LEGE 07310 TaxID=915328 RepID=A0A8J7DQ86_9CYAN|nr:Uma2 family endonuclease [Romeria aff. gracilis LEGE 07310]
MGWLIDPDEQTVFVYLPERRLEVFDRSEQRLPVPAFASELGLTVGAVLGWLLEWRTSGGFQFD